MPFCSRRRVDVIEKLSGKSFFEGANPGKLARIYLEISSRFFQSLFAFLNETKHFFLNSTYEQLNQVSKLNDNLTMNI